MSDTFPAPSSSGAFDGSRPLVPLSPADAGALGHLVWTTPDGGASGGSVPPAPPPPVPLPAPADVRPATKGRVLLDAGVLRALRESRLLSQQDLADELWRRNVQVSIATIKRAETSHHVRYRIAHALANFYGVPVGTLLKR